MTPPAAVDYSSCDREPIRIPGAIQPHGYLIVLHPSNLRVAGCSENIAQLLGSPDVVAPGIRLEAIIGETNREMVEAALAESEGEYNPLWFDPVGEIEAMLGTLHRSDAFIVLELEPNVEADRRGIALLQTRRGATRLQRAGSITALADTVVAELQELCGYDRVMLYRFDEDWHGEVIAERVVPALAPYLGLHYPASDIPSQARELYRTNWLRYIPDVSYRPVPLIMLDAVADNKPVDLGGAVLRSVSPVHIEYLHNMNVGATLTVSLLKNGALWGLIAMHHRSAKVLSYELRSAAELFGRIISLQLAALEENAALEYRLLTEETRDRLVEHIVAAPDALAALIERSNDVLSLVGADGCAVLSDGVVRTTGQTPADDVVKDILEWVCATQRDPVFVTNSLGTIDDRFSRSAPNASGIIAIPFERSPMRAIAWFRGEIRVPVAWGGDPNKPVSLPPDGGRIAPRKSFERWQAIQGLRARPWSAGEIAAARDIRGLVMGLVAQRRADFERAEIARSQSNNELDRFAHIASHDLKEPIRVIHNHASYLAEDYGDVLDEEGRDKLNTLVRLTRRMDDLLESLLQLSRIGRVDFTLERFDLDALVKEVLETYGPRIDARGARIVVQRNMPHIRADGARIIMVLGYLLSNALKYSDRLNPRIEIGCVPLTAIGVKMQVPKPVREGEWLAVFVRDDGIGIPEHRQKEIFHMFRRLHASEEFGGGTGSDLAIAQRIIERHGGVIWVDSKVREGSTFFFSVEAVP